VVLCLITFGLIWLNRCISANYYISHIASCFERYVTEPVYSQSSTFDKIPLTCKLSSTDYTMPERCMVALPVTRIYQQQWFVPDICASAVASQKPCHKSQLRYNMQLAYCEVKFTREAYYIYWSTTKLARNMTTISEKDHTTLNSLIRMRILTTVIFLFGNFTKTRIDC